MTCIVALKHDDGDIWIASDSGFNCGDGVYLKMKESKVSPVRDMVIGVAGSAAVGLAIKYLLAGCIGIQQDKHPEKMDVMEWLVTVFDPAYREMVNNLNIREEDVNITDLIIIKAGRIFIRGCTGGFTEPSKEYCSIGSGNAEAEGALYALKYSDLPMSRKVELAVEAAISRDAYVQGPVSVQKVWNFMGESYGASSE